MSKSDDDKLARGLEMLDKVYGPGPGARVVASHSPFSSRTATELFAEVWSRPHLSVRDRRLLVLGVTATLGRADLIETQVKGALINGELNEDQLEEMVLQLAYYAGWGNATAVHQGVQAALKAHRGEKKE